MNIFTAAVIQKKSLMEGGLAKSCSRISAKADKTLNATRSLRIVFYGTAGGGAPPFHDTNTF